MRIVPLVVCLGLWNATPVAAQSPMDALHPFVGVWDTEDTYYPESGEPLVETGVRTCSFDLRGTYLRCETIGTNARGVERTYWFLINHNAVIGRYEMLSLWSNVPFKAVSELRALEGSGRWQLLGLLAIGDDEPNNHYSELSFESDGAILWTGRRVSDGVAPEEAPVSFLETWRRR